MEDKFRFLGFSPSNSIWDLWFDIDKFGSWLFYNCVQNRFMTHLYDKETIKRYLCPMGSLEYAKMYGDDPLLKENIKRDPTVALKYFTNVNDSEEIRLFISDYFGVDFMNDKTKNYLTSKRKFREQIDYG